MQVMGWLRKLMRLRCEREEVTVRCGLALCPDEKICSLPWQNPLPQDGTCGRGFFLSPSILCGGLCKAAGP